MKIKQLFSVTTIISVAMLLAGCVGGSGYYDGYRDYGPSYVRTSGSGVIYRNSPRYRSGHYRSNRYYRQDRPRYDSRHIRSKNRDVRNVRNQQRAKQKPVRNDRDVRRQIKRTPENHNRRLPR